MGCIRTFTFRFKLEGCLGVFWMVHQGLTDISLDEMQLLSTNAAEKLITQSEFGCGWAFRS